MGLKFSLEFGSDKINFLDLIIINNNNWLSLIGIISLCFSKRYLNFLSLHPLSQKKV